ncbi:MAG: hypothetical protein ACFFG0_41160 [Candidatus Thorarchaeota archaeon]
MQNIINQNNFFITINYNTVKTSKRNYQEKQIKDRLNKVHILTGFHTISISNIYNRINIYKTNQGKQRFIKANSGIIANFQWMGSILEIENATKQLHNIMKILKVDFSLIENIEIYIAGNDYDFETIEGKKIVKDDINVKK